MPPSLRVMLIRGAMGSFVLKAGHTVLYLLMAVVLARVLGVEDFGIYSFCFSFVQILSVPAMLGGQHLLVREVAAYQARGDFQFLKGLLLEFRKANSLFSILLAAAAGGIGWWAYRGSPMLIPFLIAMAMVPFYSAMQLQGAMLRGLRHVLLGQSAQVLRPALIVVIVGSMAWMNLQLGAMTALSADLASILFLVAFTYFLVRRLLPFDLKTTVPEYETSRWVKSVLPFVLADGMQILNKEASIVLLGSLQNAQAVGLYRVAQRGAELVPFGLMAVSLAIAPTISELFVKGEKERLQNLINKSMLAVLVFALPMALFLIAAGNWLIPFVFGEEYTAAYLPLVILCSGQLINAAMGFMGIVLNMVGLERLTARGVAVAAVTNIILNFLFIPFLGVTGAALATSISLAVWNILLFFWLYRETGIVSTILPVSFRNRGMKPLG